MRDEAQGDQAGLAITVSSYNHESVLCTAEYQV